MYPNCHTPVVGPPPNYSPSSVTAQKIQEHKQLLWSKQQEFTITCSNHKVIFLKIVRRDGHGIAVLNAN